MSGLSLTYEIYQIEIIDGLNWVRWLRSSLKHSPFIYSHAMKAIPIHIFEVRELYRCIFYSVIGNPLIYWTKIQNKHAMINFAPFHSTLYHNYIINCLANIEAVRSCRTTTYWYINDNPLMYWYRQLTTQLIIYFYPEKCKPFQQHVFVYVYTGGDPLFPHMHAEYPQVSTPSNSRYFVL